jgi:hypothetical protein
VFSSSSKSSPSFLCLICAFGQRRRDKAPFSSCGFNRARSCLAKIIKGAKKAASYMKTRRSLQGLARSLASLLFLPAASSYNEVLTVARLDKAHAAACAGAGAARHGKRFCNEGPHLLHHHHHLTNLPISLQGLRPYLWVKRRPKACGLKHIGFN